MSAGTPDITKYILQLHIYFLIHLHVVLKNPQPHQHPLQVDPGQHALNNVSPVQTVNAVSSKNPTLNQWVKIIVEIVHKTNLSGEYTALLRLQEVAELLLVLRQPVHQD